MYKPRFNMKRPVLVFRQFGNKGYSLFNCLGREVVCSVLSVATLTYASAESVSTNPVVTDSVATTTAREMMLDEVSVTGSRAPLTKSQAARMVTVLDRADIAQAPVQSVNDLLKYAVGVDVRQRGPMGAQTDISIRGGTSEQVILLLNGINICDPQTGHNTMDLPVDLSDIVRIEVIEGPAGRIYGTSSMAGAINIVTKKGGERREVRGKRNDSALQMHAEGGSFGYANLGLRYSLTSHLSQRITQEATGGAARRRAGSIRTIAEQKDSIRVDMRARLSDWTGTWVCLTRAGVRAPSGPRRSGRPTNSTSTPRNGSPPYRDIPSRDRYT